MTYNLGEILAPTSFLYVRYEKKFKDCHKNLVHNKSNFYLYNEF